MRSTSNLADAAPPPRLIIIAVSHYCEKAVWALHRFDSTLRTGIFQPVISRLHVSVPHFLLLGADMAFLCWSRPTLQ